MGKIEIIEILLNDFEKLSETDKKKKLLELMGITQTPMVLSDLRRIDKSGWMGVKVYAEQFKYVSDNLNDIERLLTVRNRAESVELFIILEEDEMFVQEGRWSDECRSPIVLNSIERMDLTSLIQVVCSAMEAQKENGVFFDNSILSKEEVPDVLNKVISYLREKQSVREENGERRTELQTCDVNGILNDLKSVDDLAKKKKILELMRVTGTFMTLSDMEKVFSNEIIEGMRMDFNSRFDPKLSEKYTAEELESTKLVSWKDQFFGVSFDEEDKMFIQVLKNEKIKVEMSPDILQSLDLTNLIQAFYYRIKEYSDYIAFSNNGILLGRKMRDMLKQIQSYLEENKMVQEENTLTEGPDQSIKRTPDDITPATSPVRFGSIKGVLEEMGKFVRDCAREIGKFFQR